MALYVLPIWPKPEWMLLYWSDAPCWEVLLLLKSFIPVSETLSVPIP